MLTIFRELGTAKKAPAVCKAHPMAPGQLPPCLRWEKIVNFNPRLPSVADCRASHLQGPCCSFPPPPPLSGIPNKVLPPSDATHLFRPCQYIFCRKCPLQLLGALSITLPQYFHPICPTYSLRCYVHPRLFSIQECFRQPFEWNMISDLYFCFVRFGRILVDCGRRGGGDRLARLTCLARDPGSAPFPAPGDNVVFGLCVCVCVSSSSYIGGSTKW